MWAISVDQSDYNVPKIPRWCKGSQVLSYSKDICITALYIYVFCLIYRATIHSSTQQDTSFSQHSFIPFIILSFATHLFPVATSLWVISLFFTTEKSKEAKRERLLRSHVIQIIGNDRLWAGWFQIWTSFKKCSEFLFEFYFRFNTNSMRNNMFLLFFSFSSKSVRKCFCACKIWII